MSKKSKSKSMSLSSIRQATASIMNVKHILGDWMVGKNILWVDDHPANNEIIKKIFESAGASVFIAQSTKEAMGIITGTTIGMDLIISDMARGDDNFAGLRFLQKIRKIDIHLPFIVYSSSPFALERRIDIEKLQAIGPILGFENLTQEISGLFCTDQQSS